MLCHHIFGIWLDFLSKALFLKTRKVFLISIHGAVNQENHRQRFALNNKMRKKIPKHLAQLPVTLSKSLCRGGIPRPRGPSVLVLKTTSSMRKPTWITAMIPHTETEPRFWASKSLKGDFQIGFQPTCTLVTKAKETACSQAAWWQGAMRNWLQSVNISSLRAGVLQSTKDLCL